MIRAEVEHRGRHAPRQQARLLGALVSFHLAGPAIEMVSPSTALGLLLPLYILLLVAVIMTMSTGRSRFLVALLGLPLLAAVAASPSGERPRALALAVSALPFLACAALVVFRGVLSPGVIDRARLLGSASVFILVAQVWAGAYAGLEWLDAGSFVGAGDDHVSPGDLVYFSLVTQTTLGYGDIAPASPLARALATLQATAGLFYMGVVVARFAGRLELRPLRAVRDHAAATVSADANNAQSGATNNDATSP